MSHRRIRDRVEDELFKELMTQEGDAGMAQTEKTRRIVEAVKDRLAEDPALTTRQLHDRLSRDGASLPKPASFAPYATQARKELGIDGRKAVNGDPQGEDPAGESEAGAEDEAPAPPADEYAEAAALQEEADLRVAQLEKPDQENPTPERPSNEAQSRLERDSEEMLDGLEEAERLGARVVAAGERSSRLPTGAPAILMPEDLEAVFLDAGLDTIRESKWRSVKDDFARRVTNAILAYLGEEPI